MELSKVICEYATEYLGDIYFSIYKGNSLYRYNRKADESYRIGPVKKQAVSGSVLKRLYKMICPVERKLYLFPWTGDSVINVYDLDTEKISQIDVSMYDSGQHEKTEYKFCDYYIYGKNIYIIGFNFPGIIKVDTEVNDASLILDFRNELNYGTWRLYMGYGDNKDDIAFIPLIEVSAFLKLDLKSGESTKICIKGDFSGFTNIVLGANDDVFLLEKWTNLIVHTKEDGKVISIYEVPDCPEKTIEEASYFDCFIREGNGFYLFPVKANHIYFFDFDKLEFEVCNEFEGIMNREYVNNPKNNGRIYGFSHKNHYAIVIEGTSKIWHEINLSDRSVNSFEILTAKNAVVNKWNYCVETEKKGVKEFMDYIELLDRYNINPKDYQ